MQSGAFVRPLFTVHHSLRHGHLIIKGIQIFHSNLFVEKDYGCLCCQHKKTTTNTQVAAAICNRLCARYTSLLLIMSKHMLSAIEATLGAELLSKIKSSKILVVGAGGIGCELLKNLALCGFSHVQVIDLDIIDVSNLNRQLLFRSQHVGLPKCTVACEVAANMVTNDVTYQAHYVNVCDPRTFHIEFVSQFDVILNALDNVVARRRVNRIALAAGVPLVEAGTTGYLGQVSVIGGGDVACYECKPQEVQKVYPICTIRSTPSMPVHTIVWAKEFYKLLFGEKVAESMLYEDGTEPSTFMETVVKFRAELDKGIHDKQIAINLLTKFYAEEIQKQLDMERYKTALKTPAALTSVVIQKGAEMDAPTRSASYKQTDVWSAEECVAEFVACLQEAKAGVVLSSFDKDDALSMRFVTAASNLRSYVFSIEPIQSLYSAKGIAGNIIPAIATTNAIAAGCQVLQAFHILKKQMETGEKSSGLADCCRYINCIRQATRNGLYLTAAKLEPPNPGCFVCRKAIIPIRLNVDNWNLQDFLQKIVKNDLGFAEPTIMLGGDCIWEEGNDADTESFKQNLTKMLPQLPCGGIGSGTSVTIEDFSQDLEMEILIMHQDIWEIKEGEETSEVDEFHKFSIGGEKPKAAATQLFAASASAAAEEEVSDDDVVEVIDAPEDGDEKPAASELKRPANTNGLGPPVKKSKVNGNDMVEID
jgi:ubiquitin-like 1-activating enzyme E1 B